MKTSIVLCFSVFGKPIEKVKLKMTSKRAQWCDLLNKRFIFYENWGNTKHSILSSKSTKTKKFRTNGSINFLECKYPKIYTRFGRYLYPVDFKWQFLVAHASMYSLKLFTASLFRYMKEKRAKRMQSTQGVGSGVI